MKLKAVLEYGAYAPSAQVPPALNKIGKFSARQDFLVGKTNDGKYAISVKAFTEPSFYGINGGQVSKLWIRSTQSSAGPADVNYDRGWDVKPTDPKIKKLVKDILACFPKQVEPADRDPKHAFEEAARPRSVYDLKVGMRVIVPVDLTTDPIHKQGETGVIRKIDVAGDVVTVQFLDGKIGKYQTNVFLKEGVSMKLKAVLEGTDDVADLGAGKVKRKGTEAVTSLKDLLKKQKEDMTPVIGAKLGRRDLGKYGRKGWDPTKGSADAHKGQPVPPWAKGPGSPGQKALEDAIKKAQDVLPKRDKDGKLILGSGK